jgi:hypothetical protein
VGLGTCGVGLGTGGLGCLLPFFLVGAVSCLLPFFFGARPRCGGLLAALPKLAFVVRPPLSPDARMPRCPVGLGTGGVGCLLPFFLVGAVSCLLPFLLVLEA